LNLRAVAPWGASASTLSIGHARIVDVRDFVLLSGAFIKLLNEQVYLGR
jgi:hypothetical protein